MRLFIRNMFSGKSISAVHSLLEELDILFENKHSKPGEIIIPALLSIEKYEELKKAFEKKGFKIIYSRKEVRTEQIKYIIDEMLSKEEMPAENYSSFISRRMNLNYNYLANTFAATEGISIEKYIILSRVEKAKTLLQFDEYSVNKVAQMLNYSSIGHLSNQFKKITGINPTSFKKLLMRSKF